MITVGRTFFSASRKTCPDDSICGRVPALNNASLKPQYTPQPAIVYRGNPRKFGRARKWFLRFGIATVVILVVATCFLWAYWPFRPKAVIEGLEEASQTKVKYARFHGTYFPRPGCVLDNVVFQHNLAPGHPPLMTVARLRIEGTFLGLFTRHVRLIHADGLHVLIPAIGSGENFETPPRSSVVIDSLVADGGVLEFATRQARTRPLMFGFHKFLLNSIGSDGPAKFQARFSNPEPPGEVKTSGTFGPWNQQKVGNTPVAGEYSFQHADLGVYGGIAGTLGSSGKFEGRLDHVAVHGTTDTPDFAVTSSSHQVRLRTEFQATVDGTNGDTLLESVNANLWRTTIWSEGSIAGAEGGNGKTASIELATKDGRIEDLLRLFTSAPRAPMAGSVSFKAKAILPPGDRAFLDKVTLQGDFGIDGGRFTKPDTQRAVNDFSSGARGDKKRAQDEPDEPGPETVLSDLKGHVSLTNGTAHFSNLSFNVPGASAVMEGTYNLLTQKIDLRGNLKTTAQLDNTTHGIKAAMLKVLEPFFKKHKTGYIAPVKVTGTYQHPSFGLDLADGRTKHMKLPGTP